MDALNSLLKEVSAHPNKARVQPALSAPKQSTDKSFFLLMGAGLLLLIVALLIYMKWSPTTTRGNAPHHKTPPASTVSVPNTNITNMVAADVAQETQHDYQTAIAFMQNHQVPQALNTLSMAVKLNPKLNQAREALAVLLMQNNHFHQASAILDDGITISPGYLPFVQLKARILAEQQHNNAALTLLSQYTPDIQTHPDYYALMAEIYDSNQQYLVAANLYRQLTAIQPDNGQWWFGLGSSLKLAGYNDDAAAAYQTALQAGGLSPTEQAYIETQT